MQGMRDVAGRASLRRLGETEIGRPGQSNPPRQDGDALMIIRSKTMTRREFAATAILAPAALALGATLARPAAAASAKEIDVGADATLQSFYGKVQGGKDFAATAKGVLIFPSIFQAGIGIGGAYGEGVPPLTGP